MKLGILWTGSFRTITGRFYSGYQIMTDPENSLKAKGIEN